MKLQDLIGIHELSGVDTAIEHFFDYAGNEQDRDVVRFVLDGVTYKAIEDPGDGYRSYLEELEVSDEKVFNVFLPHKVLGIMKQPDYYDNDTLLFYDLHTNKCVLEIGTDNYNDYYPMCILHWSPENLAINAIGGNYATN